MNRLSLRKNGLVDIEKNISVTVVAPTWAAAIQVEETTILGWLGV
jgi:hypothetical protein